MPPVKRPPRQRNPHFIKAWREFRELTPEKVADTIGYSRTQVERIEDGKIPYNQDTLEKFAFALGCDVTDLLSVDPLKPDPPRLVYDRLRHAPKEVQNQVAAVVDALLKTGT